MFIEQYTTASMYIILVRLSEADNMAKYNQYKIVWALMDSEKLDEGKN